MPETTATEGQGTAAEEHDRPRLRDPEGTRRRILAAALQEFSAKGIDGARVDAIAERAGTNKRMLYYYFGSKDDLFRAVLRQRLAERAPMARERDRTGPARLVELHDKLEGSMDYVRLLMWEGLERGRRREVEQELLRRDSLVEWCDEVREAQRRGDLPDDLDAEQLVLSELALVMFPFAFPQITRLVTGQLPTDAAFKVERRAFLERLTSRFD
ncbi:MAG TPA: TetR family transcriptional regulator [Acidimicrobiia bacterium]|nr:TetR family transcriptional regulator [Acidimicrobiia bacterium]